MKKQFKNYSILWLIGVVMFSAIVFAVRSASADYRPSSTFIVAYIFVLLSFAGQLGLAYYFFKEENKDKVFLNMPVMRLSKSCAIVSFILGTILMVVPKISYFVAVVVAVFVLGFYAVAVVKAVAAKEAVEEIGEKVAAQTSFVKESTAKAESLVKLAKNDNTKAIATKVYEALRYSNKSSHGGLDEVESKISANLTVFADAVSSGDDAVAESVGDKLVKLISERDVLAKANK